jgi:GNAT superfamily N-acetyltransferase
MNFRTITPADYPLIRPMMREVIEAEEYLSPDRDASDAACIAYMWGDKPGSEVWVCEDDGEILGAYYQRPNHFKLGAHVANGGYMVASAARGRGVGRALGEHSIQRAKDQGSHGLQYNFVVSTNTRAVKLWQSLGFNIIGTIPGGYHRKQTEYVDAYIMYKDLTQ